MKHLLKKVGIQGARRRGRQEKAPPAQLDPPVLGVHSLAGSFAHSEILDLVSDGPIEGVVDQDGKLCNDDIFKGIYLNDTVVKTKDNKFNFANVLAQANFGEETQSRLSNFKNVYIDTTYNSELFGPYRQSGQPDKLSENKNILTNSWALTRGGQPLEYSNGEGSNDSNRLTKRNYTDWNTLDRNNETAIPVTHIISNPNVKQCFVSLYISALSDTMSQDLEGVTNAVDKKLKAGSKYPSVLYVEVETGKINQDGSQQPHGVFVFRFVSLIQSEVAVDLGNSDASSFGSYYNWIKTTSPHIFQPFNLPDVSLSGKEQTYEKRYIKVTRRSTETFSSLIAKKVKLAKVTEIIPINLNYPFSAIIGTKIDSRSFSSIPSRIFDLKLKKVKVPTNYNPIDTDGSDKRYLKNSSQTKKQVYNGLWDGTFKIAWTDNPAWILYDLITSKRYGLGQYIDEERVDKWDLYKIGRFCDAVDENGYFVGSPDLRGGLEPRFSCNLLFQEKTKLFDSINVIASLFRGIVYYNNSEISFVDDRPKTPSALFTNSNIKDGYFSYSNYKRDEQYNSIEVLYIDRFENFESKIEYVEDEEDIRKRGVFKKTISPLGVTSRAMARRIGQHFIFQTIKENQAVNFIAGLETLLCRPGDLIIIEDELKTLRSNFGRVLSVDQASRKIRLSEKHDQDNFTNTLTVYSPTGIPTLNEQNNPQGDQNIINYRNNSLVSSVSQITTFNSIQSIINKDFGSEIIVSANDINVNLIQYIAEGSPYRYKRKNLDDKIYKVLSIKEDNPNEYQVIATKYITGKFQFIEENKSIQYKEDNYYGNNGGGSNIKYESLQQPDNLTLSTQKISNTWRLYANWNSVPYATGYNVICNFPNGLSEEKNINSLSTFFQINAIGTYSIYVSALSNTQPINNTFYFNSDQSVESLFFINNDNETLIQFDRSYMYDITINN
jgi:hypothetical protein